jgi:hypothetical protein
MYGARDHLPERRPVFGSRLPPGVRDADCEHRPDPLEDAAERHLWQICGPRVQRRVSSQFTELHVELFRDAILDVEDFTVAAASERGREILLGGMLWPAWIHFRDRAMRELRRCGELAGR